MTHRPSIRARVAALLVALTLVVSIPRESRAGDWAGWYLGFLLGGEIAIMGGSLVCGIGNGVIAGRGDRPGLGWRVCGYAMGAVAVATGALFLAIIGRRGPSWGYWVGGANIVVGATTLGLTIWGDLKTKPKTESLAPQGLAFGPQIFRSATGRNAFGLQLSYVR